MRWVGWAAGGIVLGFVLGGVLPRRQAAALRAERDRLQEELSKAPRGGGRRASPLPVPGMDEIFAEDRAPVEDSPAEGEEEGEEADPQAEATDEGLPEPEPPANENLVQEYNLAVDAQRLRASQSRAALAEQADLSDEEMAAVDGIISEMNAELAQYGEDLMALALSGEEPDAEEMLGLTHEVTGILYDAQAAVNDIVGVDNLADVDPSARQVWNHVDLEVFRGAVEEMSAEEAAGGGRR